MNPSFGTEEVQAVRHEIGELDILCSKDKSLASHPGNRLFRELIEEAKPAYKQARDKATKMKITKSIVDRLQNDHGSRFVKFDPDCGGWTEVTRIEARDKVGHALRFAIKSCATKTTPISSKKTRKSKTTKLPRKISSTKPQQQEEEPSIPGPPRFSAVVSNEYTKTNDPCSTPSMEKIQVARRSLDQLFEQQQRMVQAWNTTSSSSSSQEPTMSSSSSLASSYGSRLNGNSNDNVPEVVSIEPLDLSTTDFFCFAAGDLDLLLTADEPEECASLSLTENDIVGFASL